MSFLRVSLVALAGLLLWRTPAFAHPDVDRARQLADGAEFQGALRLLDGAVRSGTLTRADAVALLELRALVRIALGDRAAASRDLAWLVALEPDHRLPQATRPDLLALHAEARARSPGPLAVTLVLAPARGGASAAAEVEHAPPGLLESTRVHVRLGNEWRTHAAAKVAVPAGPGDTVVARADATGLGGAVLADSGVRSVDIPGTRAVPRADLTQPAPEPRRLGWYVVGGVALAAAVAATLFLTLREGNNDTAPTPPMIRW